MKPANIVAAKSEQAEECGICGRTVAITVQCRVTAIRAGMCCQRQLVIADNWLSMFGPAFGICHPAPVLPPGGEQ